jgi:Flp pilus assembly pilin Flp
MELITKMFVKAQNWHKGQTMTEYALILAAVAVVVYAGYKTMGTSIGGWFAYYRRRFFRQLVDFQSASLL